MRQDPPSPHAGGSGPTELDAALKAAEANLRSGGEPSARALHDLHDLASAHPDRARRLARRLDHVFATVALRTREVPTGLLDGLYDDVRAAATEQHRGRARMSTTFLDAPRSLAVWRRFAVAASLLLGLGVTWTMTRTPDADVRSRAQPLAPDADPRYDVLEPFLSRDGLTTQAGGLPGTPRRGAAGPIGRRLPTIFFLDGNEWRSDPGAGRPRVPPASDDADGEERN